MRAFQFLIFTALLVSGTNLFAQTVNEVPIKSINSNFIEIYDRSPRINHNSQRMINRFAKEKSSVSIDFGDYKQKPSTTKATIKNEAGQVMLFYTALEAVNFFTKFGYVLYDVHISEPVHSEYNIFTHYHYILKKGK